jgi:hypothetical protein
MKAITLRDVPPELARLIQRRAEQEKMSLNKTVVRLLEEGTGLQQKKKGKPLHDDLDALAGSWTQKEARDFEQALEKQRAIDPDLWK